MFRFFIFTWILTVLSFLNILSSFDLLLPTSVNGDPILGMMPLRFTFFVLALLYSLLKFLIKFSIFDIYIYIYNQNYAIQIASSSIAIAHRHVKDKVIVKISAINFFLSFLGTGYKFYFIRMKGNLYSTPNQDLVVLKISFKPFPE
jgi:hypothetical protein